MLYSVVIPTLNAERTIEKLLERLIDLLRDLSFEIIVIDSQSSDGTALIVSKLQQKNSNIFFTQIKKRDFNHGTTRNLGVKLAKGKFILFTTQDALALSNSTFKFIEEDFSRNPDAVVVFSKDIPKISTPLIQKLDLLCRYEGFDKYANSQGVLVQNIKRPFVPLIKTNQVLWFGLSNVFACYKRDFLVKHPFPRVSYGEDLILGRLIIKKGFTKIYDSRFRVQHSHDYNFYQYFKRQIIDYRLRLKTLQIEDKPKFFCKLRRIFREKGSFGKKTLNTLKLLAFYVLKIIAVLSIKLFG